MDKATASPGQTLTYTLSYANTGGGDATGVEINDAVPARATLASATGIGVFTNEIVTWNLGTLFHGTSASVSFTVTLDAVFPNGTTPVINSAVLSSIELPDVISNVIATVVTAAPNLAVTKALTSNVARTLSNFTNAATLKSTENRTGVSESEVIASVTQGTDITYTIAYANSGNADATNVVITDPLPPGSVFVSASGGGAVNGGMVSWNIGMIAANGGSGSVTLTIRVGL